MANGDKPPFFSFKSHKTPAPGGRRREPEREGGRRREPEEGEGERERKRERGREGSSVSL